VGGRPLTGGRGPPSHRTDHAYKRWLVQVMINKSTSWVGLGPIDLIRHISTDFDISLFFLGGGTKRSPKK